MAQKFYGPVNGQSRRIKKIYGPAQGPISVTGEIDPNGDGNVTSFDGDVFWSSTRAKIYRMSKGANFPPTLSVRCRYKGGGYVYSLTLSNTRGLLTLADNMDASTLKYSYGIEVAAATDSFDIISLTYKLGEVRREVYRLYGPANGETRTVFRNV